ncbi:MAG: Gfo/Idh/MocA family oxidoreductase, partial [Treponemataceae bacterium]|nr:Gfo/Idh/MocA family oxidoreductase [Treponemataceae bacterium]
MSEKVIRWGVIGTGHITEKVMPAIKGTAGCELYAVASRTQEKAQEFAGRWGCERAYGSYDDFFADADIDAVYVATPHVNHAELSIRALNAGKHVVCEKPAGVNADQLQQVLAVAKKTGKFFMEAMWTRFQPAWLRAMELIASGKIGTLKAVSADFCFDGSPRPTERLFSPALAGGALLDVGIYSVMAALDGVAAARSMAFSGVTPATMVSTCRMTPGGVDGFDSISITFENGVVATLTAAIDTGCGNYLKSARFVGDKGIIHLPLFWQGQEVNLIGPDGAMAERIALPFGITGYEYEFEEAVRCITAGLGESPRHTWADALHLIETLDACRKQWGLKYPFEGSVSAASPKFSAATMAAA